MVKKVFIATARPTGDLCKAWALRNLPEGFSLVDTVEESDIIISVMYDKIFKKQQLANRRAFNFHPAPLPDYRGVGLSSWQLINEETKAGVTLHAIDSGVDTGDIIEVRNFLIKEGETAQSLYNKTQKLVFKMFQDWFVDVLKGNYEAVSQNRRTGRTYRSKDLQRAKDITKFIRAFCFEGKESAFYYNKDKEKVYIKYE